MPRPRELISNVEIGEKENQSPDQTDNQEVVHRFRIYSDAETDAFLKENKNKNTGQKTKSDMKIVTDFFSHVQVRGGIQTQLQSHPLNYTVC